MSTVLEVKEITKTYMLGKVPVEALRGVSFTVEQGEYISVLGPSGSGKSTLLNMIGALDRPTSGHLLITGKDTSTADENLLAALRQNVGFVFQFFNLIPRFDAIGNVELPLAISGVGRSERRARAIKLLEEVGLADRMNHRPAELSGGERQRIAVARALINNPQFILMDEPTGNLDSKTAQEIMALVKDLNDEFQVTVIVVTHDQEIGRLGKRTLRMRDGLIIAEEVN